LLTAAGAGIGVLLVMWMGLSLVKLMPAMDIPLDFGGGLNVTTLGFTVVIVAVATLLSGTVPALLTARADLNETLKEGGRTGGAGTQSHRLRRLLVTVALGANPNNALALVMWEGLRMTLPGLVAGIARALAAARLVSGMLFQVSAADPATFAAAAAFLGLVAAIASYLPAVRATQVDPITALRCQ
jgi:ABC-type antimicrobial peptide transport system permease subunit